MLSRRSFFVLGSAAATLGLIGNQPVMVAASEEERYRSVVSGANALLDSLRRIDRTPGTRWTQSPAFLVWQGQANDQMRRMLDLFPEEPKADEVRDLFALKSPFDALDLDEARQILPGLLPIAVVRQQVQIDRMPFDMTKMGGFQEFAGRYARIFRNADGAE